MFQMQVSGYKVAKGSLLSDRLAHYTHMYIDIGKLYMFNIFKPYVCHCIYESLIWFLGGPSQDHGTIGLLAPCLQEAQI